MPVPNLPYCSILQSFSGTFTNVPHIKEFLFFNISNYKITTERILPPSCPKDFYYQYCYIGKSDIFPTLAISFQQHIDQTRGKFFCDTISTKNSNLQICDKKEFSEKEKFEYMINYGIDIDKIEFMGYVDFMEKFFEKLHNEGLK